MDKMEEEMLFFDMAIKKIQFLFRYAGINIKVGPRKPSDHFKCRCVYFFNWFWTNSDLLCSVYWFIDGMRTGIDFLVLAYDAPCMIMSAMTQFKAFFMVKNEKHVHRLMDTLRDLERKYKEGKQSTVKDEIIKEEKKFLNFVFTILNISSLSTVVIFTTTPLIATAVTYYRTQELELLLPFFSIYPFDPFQIRVWPFVYLHQFWSVCIVALDICSADFFFFTCCIFIRINFRLLKYDLENVIPNQATSDDKLIADDVIKTDFKELIKRHHDLIESVNVLEIIYSKSNLIHFVSSSIIICLTGFNAVMVNDLALIVTFFSFHLVSLVQIFSLCFFADLLLTSSVEISGAVYNSRWYMTDTKFRKKILQIQTRSQKPCILTAAGFVAISLKSFMRILSTSWSYFALLRTIYSEKAPE